MKFKSFILFVIFCLSLTTMASAQNRRISDNVRRTFRDAGIQVLSEGLDISDFTLPMLNGVNFTLSQQRGRVVFLNFWATWCPPCRAEMPSMEALYQRLRNREFEMIAVNLGENRNDVTNFVNQYRLSFPVVLDTRQTTGNLYSIQAIPTTYIIDKRGLIVGRVVGSIDWNSPAVITAMEALLAE